MIENYLSMVTEEWDQNMITSIYLTTGRGGCEQPAFTRTWAGTDDYTYTYTTTSVSSSRGIERKKRRRTQDATPPITGSFFKDQMTICLMKGTQSWSDAFASTGKSSETANCAEGLVACAEGAKQTICVSPDKVETECPITDVRLVYDRDFDAEQLKDYKKAEVE